VDMERVLDGRPLPGSQKPAPMPRVAVVKVVEREPEPISRPEEEQPKPAAPAVPPDTTSGTTS